jgi:hypothetical protein
VNPIRDIDPYLHHEQVGDHAEARKEKSIVDIKNTLFNGSVSRRRFLTGVGATAGAAAALGLTAGCSNNASNVSVISPAPAVINDPAILNFALNLEYLEAEFYLRAATGSGLSAADAGTGAGAVTGGSQVTFPTTALQEYCYEIAQDELNHVRFLRQALGSAAVPRPVIDLTNSFNAAASAAGIGPSFNPFSSSNAFLVGAFVFEDVGVTAYHGAATLLTTPAYLTAAAGIMAVEAYHAAAIRSLIAGMASTTGVSTYLTYANQISALRATLGGGNETVLSINTITAANTSNAVAYDRTTDQVLHIVYGTGGGAGVKSGLFFPNGMNGVITTTAS